MLLIFFWGGGGSFAAEIPFDVWLWCAWKIYFLICFWKSSFWLCLCVSSACVFARQRIQQLWSPAASHPACSMLTPSFMRTVSTRTCISLLTVKPGINGATVAHVCQQQNDASMHHLAVESGTTIKKKNQWQNTYLNIYYINIYIKYIYYNI